MSISLNQLLDNLTDSGLLSADEVRDLVAGLPTAKQTGSAEDVARELVQQNRLTQFQAEAILAGQQATLTLGNYVLLDKLGQGGMGMVFKARHRVMDRTVAIKVLSPKIIEEPTALKRFHREVRAAAQLIHTNIVTAFDADQARGTHFLVMEYVDGQDLGALVKERGGQPSEVVVDWIIQAARGLEYAHRRGVIHRDIKPANLLLSSEGVVKILDMGLARLEGLGQGSGETDGLTESGQVMGTIDYMAPEQAEDTRHADARADIYSLGCTLYRLLTGEKIYDAPTMMKVLLAHRDAPIPSLLSRVSRVQNQGEGKAADVSTLDARLSTLDAIFQRMVAKRPEDRPQSMQSVIAELSRCLTDMSDEPATLSFSSNSSPSTISQSAPTHPAETSAKTDGQGSRMQSAATASESDSANSPTIVGLTDGADTDPSTQMSLANEAARAKEVARMEVARTARWTRTVIALMLLVVAVPAGLAWWHFSSQRTSLTKFNNQDGRKRMVENQGGIVVGSEHAAEKSAVTADDVDRGFALRFDGLADVRVASLVNLPDLAGPWTMEAFVTMEQPVQTVHANLLEFDKQVVLRISSGDNLYSFSMYRALKRHKKDTQIAAKMGERVHLAAVRWNDGIGVFVNGELGRFTAEPPLPLDRSDKPFKIGGHLVGVMDEVRLSKVARYDHETAFIPPARHKPDADTIALYHFDEGEGIVAKDSSGNGHHGEIVGATWVKVDAPTRDPTDVANRTIDLLPLIDPAKHSRNGEWKKENGVLISPHGVYQSLALPVAPTDRYRIELVATRAQGDFNLDVGLVVGGHDVRLVLDGFNERVSGLDKVQGQSANTPENPTHYSQRVFQNGQPATITVDVSPTSVHVVGDGKQIVNWTGDAASLESPWLARSFKVTPGTLFLGSSSSEFHIRKLTYTPRDEIGSARDAPPPAKAPFDAQQAQAHQEAWAKHLGVPVEYTNSIGMKFVLIPPGEFMMGSTPTQIEAALNDAREDKHLQEIAKTEAPQHKVILAQPIFLGIHEVTQADYEQVMGKNPAQFATTGPDEVLAKRAAGMDTRKHPVEWASWNDAAEFCAKLSLREKLKPSSVRAGEAVTVLNGTGYRLPSEAEWEFACRAGTTTRFWIGDTDEELLQSGWLSRNSGLRTHVVGESKANPFGLYDVHGNVWEWVQDLWEPTYYVQFQEFAALDPRGPSSSSAGLRHVVKGGPWNGNAVVCRASSRDSSDETRCSNDVGFRVALPVSAVKVKLAPPPAKAPFDAQQAQAHQEAWAKHLGTKVEATKSVGMKMILIPPGEFLMGSTDEQVAAALKASDELKADQGAKDRIEKEERPRHKVVISRPFRMSSTEVTIGQFQKFVQASKYVTEAEKAAQLKSGIQTYLNPGYPVTDDSPAAVITWNDATAFCQWLSSQDENQRTYRLPTEAEWEYACRAGTTTQYSFGDDYDKLPKYGWHISNAAGQSHPVGKLLPNAFGLFDMHGNVWEWCCDFWDEHWYQRSSPDDPIGPSAGFCRLIRGGSWNYSASRSRSASRSDNPPSTRYYGYGFRCVAELDVPAVAGSTKREIASDEWIDVLPLIDPALDKTAMGSFSGKNDWRVEAGELKYDGDPKAGKVFFPVRFVGRSLEWEIEFTRTTGNGQMNTDIPLPGGFVPISVTSDKITLRNQTLNDQFRLVNGQRAKLRIRVTQDGATDRVELFVNDAPAADWTGQLDKLKYPPSRDESRNQAEFTGVSVFSPSNYTFHAIRVRMLNGGTAELLRPWPVSLGPNATVRPSPAVPQPKE